MEPIIQVYNKAPDSISIPAELRDQPIEITIKPLIELPPIIEAGTEILDTHGLKFFGSIPDFPEREPQGEYEVREELE